MRYLDNQISQERMIQSIAEIVHLDTFGKVSRRVVVVARHSLTNDEETDEHRGRSTSLECTT
jgi:hypothetical protein